jgi:hypothetical protein
MNVLLGTAGGIPLALSIGALTIAFNERAASWASDTKASRASKDKDKIRAAGTARHAWLLALGTLGVASSAVCGQNPWLLLSQLDTVTPAAQAAVSGLSWGAAATIAGAVAEEWDNYDEGWKVLITGASLGGLLGLSMM